LTKGLEPWVAYPGIWKTSAAFWTYLRGAIRRIWAVYPPKLSWKQSQLVTPPKGYTGRAKKLGKCHYCSQSFAASALEVDHVKQAGECNSWETAYQFLYNLLDCNNNWVLACKPCHKVKSYAERTGLDFKDAMAEKKAIEYVKSHNTKQQLDYLVGLGYNARLLTNASKRRAALVETFKKESDE
jgi:glutaredoxin